jgi:putative phosphoesterase
MKIAVLSDIHGNSWALKEVLSDIKQRGIKAIYDLGDSLYGPLDPANTFELIKESNIISIRGNQDRKIIENNTFSETIPTLNYVLKVLSIEAINWLSELPFSRIIENAIFACHGTPQSDTEYLIEQLNPGYIDVRDFVSLNNSLSDIKEKIVLCGHSHTPHIIETGTKTIINPGSVGLPAYDDDLPIAHKMQNFSPHTRYCILDLDKKYKIEQVILPYDFEKAATMAERNNRPDWAKWIRTGTI